MLVLLLFGNGRSAMALAGGIAAVSLAIPAILAAVARRKLRRASQTAGELDDLLLEIARRTRLFLLVVPAFYLGSRAIVLPQAAAASVLTVARLSIVVQAAFWSAAVIDFAVRSHFHRRAERDPSAVTTIRAFRYGAVLVVWCIAILLALDVLGLDVTALVTGLGIGGIVIALATQNILGDLFASLSIVIDKPFVVGDFISAGDDCGTVEHIGLKTTRVRALSGELLVFANGDLLRSRVRNFQGMEERRVLFRVGVIYRTPRELLARIPGIVRAIIERQTPVRFDRAHFSAFGPSSYDFEFVYYVGSPRYEIYMDIQQAINLAIVDVFAAEGIEFAYPTQTLIIERAEPHCGM